MTELIILWIWIYGYARTLEVIEEKRSIYTALNPTNYIAVFVIWPKLYLKHIIKNRKKNND